MTLLVKRRRRADPRALITSLGGDASVPAFYDTRYNVTSASGVASQWGDVRGSGFGPALTASGTTRPAWDAVAQTLTFDGVDDAMTSGLSSVFDLAGAFSLVFVGAVQQTAATAFALGIADANVITRGLLVRQAAGASPLVGQQSATTATLASSTVNASTTRRLVIVSKNGTTGFAIDVPSTTRVSNTGAGNVASGNNALTIGAQFAPGSNPGMPIARAVLCLNRQVTASDIAILLAWAVSNHGAVAA